MMDLLRTVADYIASTKLFHCRWNIIYHIRYSNFNLHQISLGDSSIS